ncbi:MAG TPA: alpha/beta fold hydrolase, partial [Opitutaceae bacterium]|nr:alpha/beta fold hydrolase [Opitutaceae bacterium]
VLIDAAALEVSYQPLPIVPKGDPADTEIKFPDPQLIRRRCRVIGIDPRRPGFVVIEAIGSRNAPTESYRVNVRTGATTRISTEDAGSRTLYDRDGFARVRETARIDRPPFIPGLRMSPPEPHVVPQRIEVHAAGPHGGWHSLDGLTGKALHFTHADADFYGPRSIPLAFGADPNVLYYASNVGRDTYGIYALDPATGVRLPFSVESDGFDIVTPGEMFNARPLVFDHADRLVGVRLPGFPPTTRWLDPTLARIDGWLHVRFPDRQVRILQWDDAGRRYLVLVSGPTDPGRYYLYEDGPAPTMIELLRRTLIRAEDVARVVPFSLVTRGGVRLTGTMTLPRNPRLSPPPLLVWCRDIPGERLAPSEFDRPSQAFAAQGFLVLTLNPRGTGGFGRQHRDAIRAGVDRVPLEDIQATLDWMAPREPFDRRRMVIGGEGFGGYLALRAAELFPGEFRAVFGLDAPTDPVDWITAPEPMNPELGNFRAAPVASEAKAHRRAFFGPDLKPLEAISVRRDAAALRASVLILQDPLRRDLSPKEGPALRDALRRLGRDVQEIELPPAYGRDDGDARFRAFQRIGDFLNDRLFSYRVDVGHEQEVK